MIGWRPCSYTCGCLDEDACMKAPKNSNFCRACGATLCDACATGPRDEMGRIFVRGHSLNDPGYWARSLETATCEIGKTAVPSSRRNPPEDPVHPYTHESASRGRRYS